MTFKALFDIPHLYYLPQYKPVFNEFKKRGIQSAFCFYEDSKTTIIENIIETEQLPHIWFKNQTQALAYYQSCHADWVIFGNDFRGAGNLKNGTRSALLFHGSGTGIKGASLSPGLAEFTVRFVSGEARIPVFKQHFPNVKLVVVGFAKLDPIFNTSQPSPKLNMEALGLDTSKRSILYAPTFYPSSIENMPKDWPRQLAHYNIMIKPHDFTFTKKKYAHQLKSLQYWASYPNVHLTTPENYSIIPYMASTDLMISDTSSAIFEFASLDKPVLICDFIKLRWNYRGPFRYRLKKRLDDTTKQYYDIAAHIPKPGDLINLVETHMSNPSLLHDIRMKYAEEIIGRRDGKVAERIVDYLFPNGD